MERNDNSWGFGGGVVVPVVEPDRPSSGTTGRRFASVLGAILSAAVLSVLGYSCGVKEPEAVVATPRTPSPELSLALSTPRWVELYPDQGSGGIIRLRQLEDPQDAYLGPFVPWPHAVRAVGLAIPPGGVPGPKDAAARTAAIVSAVQGMGFLEISVVPGAGGAPAAEFRVLRDGSFSSRSVAAEFLLDGNCAALLYRDSFFLDPSGPAPSPRFVLFDPDRFAAVGVSVGALEAYPPSGSWDIDDCRSDSNGGWAFRAVNAEDGTVAHLRTRSLSEPAESVSAAEYREASFPRPAGSAPEPGAAVLDAAAKACSPAVVVAAFLGTGPIAADYGSIRDERRLRSALLDPERRQVRAWGCVAEDRAFLLTASGDLFYGDAEGVRNVPFPAPSQGFAYTGLCVSGDLLVASWEEQDSWSVGAAGYLVASWTALSAGRP